MAYTNIWINVCTSNLAYKETKLRRSLLYNWYHRYSVIIQPPLRIISLRNKTTVVSLRATLFLRPLLTFLFQGLIIAVYSELGLPVFTSLDVITVVLSFT